MSDTDWTQCPECGWTGRRSELEGEAPGYRCPICEEDIELVD